MTSELFTGAMLPIDNIKCVIVGDGAVGKTCLLIVYAEGTFPKEYVPTVFDNYSAKVNAAGKDIGIDLWDTAGQEDYDALRPLSYTDADMFLLCFSVVNPTSLLNITTKWVPEIEKHNPGAMKILVGTKADLRSDEDVLKELKDVGTVPVTAEEGTKIAANFHAEMYLECSSFKNTGVKEVFDNVVDRVVFSKKGVKKKKCVLL